MKRYSPTLMKMGEMQLNESVAAEIGRFFLEHNHGGQGGNIELIPDNKWDLFSSYEKQKVLDKGE
jgi:hypothetical protein